MASDLGSNAKAVTDFAAALRKIAIQTPAQTSQRTLREYSLEALRRIVQRTPVDTGLARGNWQLTAEVPATGIVPSTDRSGQATLASGAAAATALRPFGVSWITNNLPYVRVLEFGLYPNPPKRGSRIRQKGRRRKNVRAGGSGYEIRSAGGFSRQAPQGMVQVTAAEIQLMVTGV